MNARSLRNLNLSLTCTISHHEEPVPVANVEPALRAAHTLLNLKKHLPKLQWLAVDLTLSVKCCAVHAKATTNDGW